MRALSEVWDDFCQQEHNEIEKKTNEYKYKMNRKVWRWVEIRKTFFRCFFFVLFVRSFVAFFFVSQGVIRYDVIFISWNQNENNRANMNTGGVGGRATKKKMNEYLHFAHRISWFFIHCIPIYFDSIHFGVVVVATAVVLPFFVLFLAFLFVSR